MKQIVQRRRTFKITAVSHQLFFGKKTHVMGIINVTPDSFSADGCLRRKRDYIHQAVALGKKFVRQGADILDIGGESSRPGAKRISAKEEIARVVPVIKILAQSISVPISVDTTKTEVAQQALDAGASIINNIKGSKPSKNLLRLVRNYNAAIILMHIKGTPRTMQKNTCYTDVVDEIIGDLKKSINICLDVGLSPQQIILDPGIGFGKTGEHNLEIIRRLKEFSKLKYPLLMGTSRKSFIGAVLDRPVDKRLIGSLTTVCVSVMNGAHIVRVHDVKETKETIDMMDAILN